MIFDPHAHRIITSPMQRMQADYNPFEGREAEGQPREVLLHGRVVSRCGVVIEDCAGELLSRGTPQLFRD